MMNELNKLIEEIKLQIVCTEAFIDYVQDNEYHGDVNYMIDVKDDTLLGYAYEVKDFIDNAEDEHVQLKAHMTIDVLVRTHHMLEELREVI